MKSALERLLDTEMDVHLGCKKLPGSLPDSLAQVATSRPTFLLAHELPKDTNAVRSTFRVRAGL